VGFGVVTFRNYAEYLRFITRTNSSGLDRRFGWVGLWHESECLTVAMTRLACVNTSQDTSLWHFKSTAHDRDILVKVGGNSGKHPDMYSCPAAEESDKEKGQRHQRTRRRKRSVSDLDSNCAWFQRVSGQRISGNESVLWMRYEVKVVPVLN